MRELNKVHLSGLRAVEAAGRLGTLAAAAAELGVTAGALSQRLQKAESALGCSLFQRTSKGLVLSAAGAKIMPRLTRGMADLAAAVALADSSHDNCLTVSVAPLFASRWLVWRLRKFNELYPHIRIRIEPNVGLVNPDYDDIDACVRVGCGGWSHVSEELLFDQRVFPVCSAEIAVQLKHPQDLANVPIIRENDMLQGWDVWLRSFDLAPDILGEGPTYAEGSLCLDAAMTGQGVYMAWETLACDALDAGRIAAPFDTRIKTGASYWFITGRDTSRKKNVLQFRSWLREELSASANAWKSAE
jgi:DNA-binding transcriptional LysR family regulator